MGACMKNLETIGALALKVFKEYVPYKDGNLRDKATNGMLIGAREYEIRVDASIAPYAMYTQVPWSDTSPLIWRSVKHPEWNGRHHSFLYYHRGFTPTHARQNPHEGWVGRAVLATAKEIAKQVKGELQP